MSTFVLSLARSCACLLARACVCALVRARVFSFGSFVRSLAHAFMHWCERALDRSVRSFARLLARVRSLARIRSFVIETSFLCLVKSISMSTSAGSFVRSLARVRSS